jgi:hypothetical protein
MYWKHKGMAEQTYHLLTDLQGNALDLRVVTQQVTVIIDGQEQTAWIPLLLNPKQGPETDIGIEE